jgi:hypothetical protein
LPNGSAEISPTKFYGKKDEEVGKTSESTERKHRVKVFQSKKSRNDDLLKDMTETAKNNKINKVDPTKENDTKGDKALARTSLGSKPEKRPSIDGIEKPGDLKKQKMSQDEKSKDKESKLLQKEKEKAKAITVIKESSLFMDALTASSDTLKEKKRKRRLSSTIEKDATIIKPPSRNNGTGNVKEPSAPKEESPAPAAEPMKPVFNFYRDTMADNETASNVHQSTDPSSIQSSGGNTANSSMDVDDDDIVLFNDGFDDREIRLKSALVILRSKSKPKKTVRWREDDEIKEVFNFEMDETERVNVTRLVNKGDFSSMKEMEKAEEKQFRANSLKLQILGMDDGEEKMPWRKPTKVIINREIPAIISEEKHVQEERERLNLGVFLPPGSLLPESPAEPVPLSPSSSQDQPEIRYEIKEILENSTLRF